MLNIGAGEIGLILILALLILGPKRLPEMARGIGKFMREFRRQTDEVRTVVEREFYRMDQELDGGKTAPPNAVPKLPGVIAAEAAAAARANRAAGVPSPALAGPAPSPAATPDAATANAPSDAPPDATPAVPQLTAAPGAVPVETTRSKPPAPAWEGEPNGLDEPASTGPLDSSFAQTQENAILSPDAAKALLQPSADPSPPNAPNAPNVKVG